jgi:hypothetical protein
VEWQALAAPEILVEGIFIPVSLEVLLKTIDFEQSDPQVLRLNGE